MQDSNKPRDTNINDIGWDDWFSRYKVLLRNVGGESNFVANCASRAAS